APEDECLFPGVAGVEFAAYAGELVGMTSKDAMQRAHEVLDYVGLGEARYRRGGDHPNRLQNRARPRASEVLDCVGLGEARYRRVETYSTGIKQRLKLAAAIVHDPQLLILDEPT